MKKAIILAAGVGKRLGKLTSDTPKCLLAIDSDKTLIDYSLVALRENSISEIIFVTGFQEEKLKKHVFEKWKNKFSFKFIFNEKFSEYNNIYSAYLAKDYWNDETILLNSDIIFHSDIMQNLCNKIGGRDAVNRVSTSFLVIDNTKKLTNEAMKVKINSDYKIIDISKKLKIEDSFGEYIGVTFLRGVDRAKFFQSIEKNLEKRNFDMYYEDALNEVLNKINVCALSTGGKPWTEVDTIEDYRLAINLASNFNKVPSI